MTPKPLQKGCTTPSKQVERKATSTEQKHWERGQEIADRFERLATEVEELDHHIEAGHTTKPAGRKLHQQVCGLRDFLAASHLPGETPDSSEGGR